jgi:uncharacterized protein YegP (UPF0339 family)
MLESHFEIFRGADALYYFHLRNHNAEVLLTGYPYFFKPGCYIGIVTIRSHCQLHYFKRTDAPFAYSFRMVDKNNDIIAHSISYLTSTERDHAIREVLTIAALAPVVYLGSIMAMEADTVGS